MNGVNGHLGELVQLRVELEHKPEQEYVVYYWHVQGALVVSLKAGLVSQVYQFVQVNCRI